MFVVFFIIGGGFRLFVDKGDLGLLVFCKFYNLDKEVIEVYVMVYGKVLVLILNVVIICFFLKDGCESLKKYIFDI